MERDIVVPVDPEDGLTDAAVAALHAFVLAPDDLTEQFDRIEVLLAWQEWCLDEELTAESLDAEATVVQLPEGEIEVRTGRRRPRGARVVGELSAELQQTLLECPLPGDAWTGMVIATACVEELLGELRMTLADDEKMFGHCVLVHGLDPGVTGHPAHVALRERHREAHRRGDGFAGHHVVARGDG